MHYLLLGIILGFGLYLFGAYFARLDSEKKSKVSYRIVLASLILAVLLFMRTGAVIPAAVTLIILLFALGYRFYLSSAVKSPASITSRHSHLTTDYLVITLDPETGSIEGQILKGRYKMRVLDSLELGEGVAAYRDIVPHCPESAELLAEWLDKTFGEEWRSALNEEENSKVSVSASSDPSLEEARAILGVSTEATEEEIRQAHKNLMRQYHPDNGGSAWIAQKINRARDILLEQGVIKNSFDTHRNKD